MTRSAITGLVVFGLAAAAAGYAWTVLEFPFALILAGGAGVLAITWPYGPRRSFEAALAGGLTFTVVFLAAMFTALSDRSPVEVPAWGGAVLATVAAAAVTGLILEGRRGILPMSGFSLTGTVVGLLLSYAVGRVVTAPAAPGAAQAAFFSANIGLVGAVLGAGMGAGVGWLRDAATRSTP